MCINKDQDTVYQAGRKGLDFTTNIYSQHQQIDKESSDKHLVIIILKGNCVIKALGGHTCTTGKDKLIFIPAHTSWTIEFLHPGQTLEIQFSNLNSFYCEPYFRSLLPLCHNAKYEINALHSCTAIEEYAERVMDILHKKQHHALSHDYELFIILGVYYPKSKIADFLNPFLKTLEV